MTLTSFSPVCSTGPPCPPIFNRVCPISPSTLLHHPCPYPPSATPRKTCSACLTCFFVFVTQALATTAWAPNNDLEVKLTCGRSPTTPPTLLNRIFGLNLSPFLGQAHCLDCTFLVSLFSGLEPGHKKVLPPIPRPCCHICPLPPIPTNPPAPSLSLFPCPNLFTFLLCTLTLVFFAMLYTHRLRSQICLPS